MDTKENFNNFLRQLKDGRRDIFNLIGTQEAKFEAASFEELIANTDDVLAGVNKVLKNFRDRYFDCFDSCLVKYHDNRDLKFIFYTVTKDASKIIEMADVLFSELGTGLTKDSDFFPFTEQDRIKEIAGGQFERTYKDIVTVWRLNDINILLQYRVHPLWQFSLMITQTAETTIDKSIRRNGTILDCLSLDIASLFDKQPLYKKEEIENEVTKFVDYTFLLEEPQFEIFDTATVRIFGPKEKFYKGTQTHVTLVSSNIPDYFKQKSVAEKLIKLYGSDNIGSGDLGITDLECLQNGDWLGRSWTFNQFNGLLNYSNKEEKFAYQVNIGNTLNENEDFGISILCFNELVSLFGITE